MNCIIVDDEPVAREILETYLEKMDHISLVKSCQNVKEALEEIGVTKIDLILLDINMPEISGLTLAKVLDPTINVIFTTAYREYAVDGFNLKAVDYLLKPISFNRFSQAIDRLRDNRKTIDEGKAMDFIFIRSERKMVKIDLIDILYIESLSDYIKIYTKDKMIMTRETISKMSYNLPSNRFLRIHRSFIIAIDKIDSYTNEFVEIRNKMLPISRSYKEGVLKVFESF